MLEGESSILVKSGRCSPLKAYVMPFFEMAVGVFYKYCGSPPPPPPPPPTAIGKDPFTCSFTKLQNHSIASCFFLYCEEFKCASLWTFFFFGSPFSAHRKPVLRSHGLPILNRTAMATYNCRWCSRLRVQGKREWSSLLATPCIWAQHLPPQKSKMLSLTSWWHKLQTVRSAESPATTCWRPTSSQTQTYSLWRRKGKTITQKSSANIWRHCPTELTQINTQSLIIF